MIMTTDENAPAGTDGIRTRAAACTAGLLLTAAVVLLHLPPVLLLLPAGIIALGIAAGTAVLHAVWYGVLSTLGIFDVTALDEAEKEVYKGKRHCFWFGEVATAAVLAGAVAAPVGSILAPQTGPALAFTATAVLFLPLFVFLPKLLKRALAADTDAVLALFGKNEQVQRAFWGIFAVFAGIVLAEALDPAAAQKITEILAGMG
jgi:hypothetical protein